MVCRSATSSRRRHFDPVIAPDIASAMRVVLVTTAEQLPNLALE